jgi:hypothetical protein
MRYSFAKFGIVLAILVCAARPAESQVISIIDGTFISEGGGGQLNISGTQAFRLEAAALTGRFDAVDQCFVPECPPGTVVELGARWIGNDLPGTATLRGKTYDDVGGLDSLNSADVRFAGQFVMPPLSDGPVSITVPFDFAGRFAYSEDLSEVQDALLTGGGQVTLVLEQLFQGSWSIRSAAFEFRPVRRH